jgi:hypothetical protein
VAADALEKSVLESKDKEQLVAIATALGIKAGPRAKKEDIITKILDTVGGPAEAEPAPEKPKRGPGRPRRVPPRRQRPMLMRPHHLHPRQLPRRRLPHPRPSRR